MAPHATVRTCRRRDFGPASGLPPAQSLLHSQVVPVPPGLTPDVGTRVPTSTFNSILNHPSPLHTNSSVLLPRLTLRASVRHRRHREADHVADLDGPPPHAFGLSRRPVPPWLPPAPAFVLSVQAASSTGSLLPGVENSRPIDGRLDRAQIPHSELAASCAIQGRWSSADGLCVGNGASPPPFRWAMEASAGLRACLRPLSDRVVGWGCNHVSTRGAVRVDVGECCTYERRPSGVLSGRLSHARPSSLSS